jgi:hypothetical protein
MSSEVRRQADRALRYRDRSAFRALGRSVMKLLQAASDPALLVGDLSLTYPKILSEVIAEGTAPKVAWACARARQLARKQKKVLIWTSFRREVEIVASRLSDLGAVYIHGGVDAGSSDDDDSREGKIRLFHDSPDVHVMVANPAAASEGISLHRVCQHAIYLDRTYNAAHYLQSEDRIHRLGLQANQRPTIEILTHAGTIDDSVERRLVQKTFAMARVLNDPELSIQSLDWDSEGEEYDEELVNLGLGDEDLQDLLGITDKP